MITHLQHPHYQTIIVGASKSIGRFTVTIRPIGCGPRVREMKGLLTLGLTACLASTPSHAITVQGF